MSCLTESYFLFENPRNPNDDNNDNNKKSNNLWYNRVYICTKAAYLKRPLVMIPIHGFHCSKLYISNSNSNSNSNSSSTNLTIPVCKWVPEIFDKWILQYKLKKYL
jgi:hypothetical protein